MANPNFASLLDETPDEVVRPKPLPAGTYHCVVSNEILYDKSSKKQTEFVRFYLRPYDAAEDVDPDELETAGGLDGKQISATFYLTPDSVYRLDEFHQHCGVDLSVPLSRKLRNDECINAEVTAVIRHRSSDDGSQVFAELARTAPGQ